MQGQQIVHTLESPSWFGKYLGDGGIKVMMLNTKSNKMYILGITQVD
jgi:hypothetical protein